RFGAFPSSQQPSPENWLQPQRLPDWQDAPAASPFWTPPWSAPAAPRPQQYVMPPPYASRPGLPESTKFTLRIDVPTDWLNPVDAHAREPNVILAGGIPDDQLNATVRTFVSTYCLGTINRQIPGQFWNVSIAEVMKAAQGGD